MSGQGPPPPPEKLTLAYQELFDINVRTQQQFGPYVKELDLSYNNLRDLSALKSFTKLETVVLDGNQVTSHTKFPKLPKLHTLWVNGNKIDNLILFMDKLADNTPNLKFLSMLKNEACPNYFNGKTLKEYADYRLYVISRLPSLTTLDSSPVTDQEKAEAQRLYAALPLPSKPSGPVQDIRAPMPKPEPAKPVPKRRKKKSHADSLPQFLNGGAPMGPPPDSSGAATAPTAGEDEYDESSDFSSEGGVDSDDWTDDEGEEDTEVIVETHVLRNPPAKQ